MMNAMVGETKSSGMDQGLELAEQKSENSRMTEKENEELNDTVQWMHKTIWDLLHKNKALEHELEKYLPPHHSQEHFESDRII